MASLSGSLGVWRGAAIFLLLVVMMQFYWILSDDRPTSALKYHAPIYRPPPACPTPPPPPTTNSKNQETWSYESKRDASNTGLSPEQCDYAFPNLYYEINRAVSLWQDRNHTITPDDVDIKWRNDGAMRLMIYDNQLRILEVQNSWYTNMYRIRAQFTLLAIHRALLGAQVSGEKLPNIEFGIVVDDLPLIPMGDDDTHSIWGYTRRLGGEPQERVWMMPDFQFFASPPIATSYTEMQQRAMEHDMPLADKIPKMVWRGVIKTNPELRNDLIKATKDQPWADVVAMVWQDEHPDTITMEDMCRYRFVTHTEGRSWSGRMKFLFNCNSIPIVHDLDWTTSWYHLLTPSGPEQNYINVKRDWSDLEEKITYYLQRPEEAQQIADNSVANFRERYTSIAAEACYWRKLIRGWRSVSFDPEPFETVTVEIAGEKVKKQQLRGTAFEEFIYIKNADMQEG